MISQPPLTLALVGRPNVGKSTLFNRLIGRRKTIVSALRGTTRDRVYGELIWRGRAVALIDTGGFELRTADGLGESVQRHIRRALEDADALVLLCDAQEGIVPADALIIETLRKTGKPLVVVANKLDEHLVVPPEVFSLGVPEVMPISALHGRGIGELLDRLVTCSVTRSSAPSSVGVAPSASSQDIPRLAIVGRQNVGKSSLMNALLREERVIVSDQPGTTRDAVDSRLVVGGRPVVLIDTAGLRHRRKVRQPVDLFAMARSLEALERCDVALVVLDATQGATRDDQRIITRVCELGCGLVLVVNKWDLIKGGRESALVESLRRALPSVAFAPIVAVSATTGYHISQSVSTALQVFANMRTGLPEAECLTLVHRIWHAQRPPRIHGRVIQVRGATWYPGRPTRLKLTTRPAGPLPRPYQQYLLKRLHAHPKLMGVPVTIVASQVG